MPSPFALSEFDFHLDEQRIALKPASPRDSAKLLVVPLKKKSLSLNSNTLNERLVDVHVRDLPKLLRPGDTLVINTTKVFPARLLGKRSTGGVVEVLLLHMDKPGKWICLGKSLPKPQTVHRLDFSKKLTAQVLHQNTDGTWLLAFSLRGKEFWKEVERLGRIPIPPYLKSIAGQKTLRTSYQTVFAEKRGSAAAPTAGLHFTPGLLKQIQKMGVTLVPVTLHVGWGTFAPIREQDIRRHQMHAEWGEISASSWQRLVETKQKSAGRVIAVGTTALRVVEAAARDTAHKQGKWSGWIQLFLKPGDRLHLVDGLLTNFHLPKTTLFVLICALLGTRQAKAVYAEAMRRNFRWASFGDAMLILPD